MLSIRGKTILIVIAIVLIITVSTLGAGLFLSQYRFMKTVKSDLLTMSRIASGMVSSEMRRVRQEVEFAAELVGMGHKDIPGALEELMERYPAYLAFSVFTRGNNTLEHAGVSDARPSIRSRDSSYGQRAFAGETVVTTTMDTPSGNLVMDIWAPIDQNHVLVATLPGMYLSGFISQFRIWETGNIFILDNEGVSIAAVWDFRVRERHNYIEWARRDPRYREIGKVFQDMVDYDEGFGRYSLDGIERYCAYGSIHGTDNWSVGIAAMANESPLAHIQQMLFILSAVFLGLGVIAALIAANSIAIPYERMEELSRSAEAASESKSRFLANMSHEMRTPLNAIIGLSELELGAAHLDGETFANVEKIYSAGMNLLGIINDLLDISKIESGKFTMVPVVYDVPSMINDTINLNIVRIGSKPIQFRLHLNGSIPSRLKGDELRVKQIFNNFLSNAFKYTDSGYVDWNIYCKKDGNRVKVISTIRDTGMGIRKEDQEKLFKDYFQANLHANYYVEGTGLGLSITNNLVKLMGGSIKVKSEFGNGSVFIVEFFQESVGDETIGDEAAENLSRFRYSDQRRTRNQKLPRVDMSYATVLVVDDVITNLDVARGMLKPYGITVECVTSGEEAVKRIREEKVRYNAIFMDQMMPGMDGIEAVRIIRKEIGTEYAKTVPVIALTANALLGSDSLFLENGFQAFLSKPIDILRLDNILNHWVRDKKQERKQPPPARLPEPAPNAWDRELFKNAVIPEINTGAALARFDHDEEAYLRILQSFCRHTGSHLDTARSVSAGSLDKYRIAVHSVKGSGRGIGAVKLGDLAAKLEHAAVQGDWAYIEANNSAFIAAAEKVIDDISAFLQTVPDANGPVKPEKESPGPETVAALRQAAEQYDITALRQAIETLDAFRYRHDPDLAGWLREQAGKSNFAAIRKRLEEL